MKKMTVALLSGGISPERDVSLKSGDEVFKALDKGKYEIRQYDPATDLPRLVADAPEIDIALIILHGPFGEDGTIQGFLDMLNIPYQGSGVLGSALAMDKAVAKRLYKDAGLLVPPFKILKRRMPYEYQEIVKEIGLPLLTKPASGGSSIGMHLVSVEAELEEALEDAFRYDATVIVEAYIKGREITGAVLGNEALELLPIVEIIPRSSQPFFDYTAKYDTTGATREICPAPIDDTLAEQAQQDAATAHRALCCEGYSRTDMIVRDEKIFVLETKTIPGMTSVSLFPLAAKTAGLTFGQLLDRLIKLGLESHQRDKRDDNS